MRNLIYTTTKGFWSGFVVMVIVPAFYLVAGFIEKLN
jgi:hypothetical protein